MVATGQEMVKEKKITSRSGKSQEISLQVREKFNIWKKSGKSEILRLLIYSFPSTFTVFEYLKLFCTFESCVYWWSIGHIVCFSRTSIFYALCRQTVNSCTDRGFVSSWTPDAGRNVLLFDMYTVTSGFSHTKYIYTYIYIFFFFEVWKLFPY